MLPDSPFFKDADLLSYNAWQLAVVDALPATGAWELVSRQACGLGLELLTFRPAVIRNPQTTGIEAQTLGIEAQTVGSEPQTVGIEPQTLGSEPQTMGSELQTLGIGAQTVGIEPQTVGSESQTVGSEPQEAILWGGLRRRLYLDAAYAYHLDTQRRGPGQASVCRHEQSVQPPGQSDIESVAKRQIVTKLPDSREKRWQSVTGKRSTRQLGQSRLHQTFRELAGPHEPAKRREDFGVEMTWHDDLTTSQGRFRPTTGRGPQQKLYGRRGVKNDQGHRPVRLLQPRELGELPQPLKRTARRESIAPGRQATRPRSAAGNAPARSRERIGVG